MLFGQQLCGKRTRSHKLGAAASTMGQPLDFDHDGRDWPNRNASRFFTAGRVRFHVQMFGFGDNRAPKPVLLLIHGTGSSTHSWRRIIPLLETAFAIVVPDLPGHGFSSNPGNENLTLSGMAADVSQLMQTLGIVPDVLAGHSAGAAIAIRATLDRGLTPRAIVSLNGALFPFGGSLGQLFAPLSKAIFTQSWVANFMAWRAGSQSAVENLLRGTGSLITAEDIDLYGRLFRNEHHVAAVLAMMANWDLRPLVKDAARLDVPLTLVTGLNDKAIPPTQADAFAKITPDAAVVRLEGLGHLAHEERPDLVAPVIIKAAQAIANPIHP